ncbi:hypothetical protein D3C78_1354870 [compost metagenome]
MQVFAGEELADRTAQHGAAVAHAGIGGLAGALEVQVPVLARVVEHLAQQQPTPVAQARVVGAELVPRIDHGPWLGLGPELVPGKQLGEHLGLGLGRIEIEQGHGRWAGHHQARLGDGLGQHLGGEGVAQAGEAVVEGQFVEGFQDRYSGKSEHSAQTCPAPSRFRIFPPPASTAAAPAGAAAVCR